MSLNPYEQVIVMPANIPVAASVTGTNNLLDESGETGEKNRARYLGRSLGSWRRGRSCCVYVQRIRHGRKRRCRYSEDNIWRERQFHRQLRGHERSCPVHGLFYRRVKGGCTSVTRELGTLLVSKRSKRTGSFVHCRGFPTSFCFFLPTRLPRSIYCNNLPSRK